MILESLFAPQPPGWNTFTAPIASAPAPGAPPMGAFPVFATPDLSWPPSAAALVAAFAAKRGQPAGPTTDAEIEDFLYDTFEFLPGAADVEVRCEAGRVTLSGTVSHKRQKRDVGEIAWAIPSLADVQNTVTIASRRRARASARENEAQPGAARKHA